MTQQLQRILLSVQKPARYTGGEYNEIQKDPAQVRVDVAFCFPDTYEIGMSNVGMRILYGVMNEMDGVWCQRVFAPWGDMEEAMRQHDIPLWALESGKVAAAALDVVSTEPIKKDNVLLKAKNCIITPHISWATKEARERSMQTTAENIKSVIDGAPQNVVNK